MGQPAPLHVSTAAYPLARALRRLLDAQAALDAALLAEHGELAADLALEELSRAEEHGEAALAAWYVIGSPAIEVRELPDGAAVDDDLDPALRDMFTTAVPASASAAAATPAGLPAGSLDELADERTRTQAGAGLVFAGALVVIFVAGLLLGLAAGERAAPASFVAAPATAPAQARP